MSVRDSSIEYTFSFFVLYLLLVLGKEFVNRTIVTPSNGLKTVQFHPSITGQCHAFRKTVEKPRNQSDAKCRFANPHKNFETSSTQEKVHTDP